MTNSDSSPILHGANISPYVRKVRVVLAYKGIEYNNTQNSANHVHAIWRNLEGDFNLPAKSP